MASRQVEVYTVLFDGNEHVISLPGRAFPLPVQEMTTGVGSGGCALLFDVPVGEARVDRKFKVKPVSAAAPYVYDDLLEMLLGATIQRTAAGTTNKFVVMEVF